VSLGQYLVALALYPNHAIDSIEAFLASLYLSILLLSLIKDALKQYKAERDGLRLLNSAIEPTITADCRAWQLIFRRNPQRRWRVVKCLS